LQRKYIRHQLSRGDKTVSHVAPKGKPTWIG
jgi:hypothetical protein